MKAVVCSGVGGVEVLGVGELPEPVPGPREVLIDVRAAALNRADLLQRRGLYPPPPGASEVLGLECSGVVAARGEGATRFELGARVMALLPGGGYAEQVVAHEGTVLPVPERLSFEEAAAVPEAFLVASEALLGEAELYAGQRLLVTAAASGVGSAAVQIAKLLGAFVIGSASAGKLERVSALGADLSLERSRTDYVDAVRAATGGQGVDAIVDFVGASALERHQKCLAERGRLIVVGLLGGATGSIDLGRLLARRQRVCGLVMRTRSAAEKAAVTARFERELGPALASGALYPLLDRVFSLAEVRQAHERMEQNLNAGKIVLRVA